MPDSVLRKTAFIDTIRILNDPNGNPRGWHLFRDKTGSVIGLIERDYGTDSLRRQTEERIGRTIGYGQSFDGDMDEHRRWKGIDAELSGIAVAYRVDKPRYRSSYEPVGTGGSVLTWRKLTAEELATPRYR